MVFQLRHITKVQEVWRFSHNNNSRKAKHSAKMHFALLAHVLKKKTKYRLFLHALRDLRHFLWSVYLPSPSSLTVQCTVFENQLKYLIHLNIDFNAKDLCGKTPFVNACNWLLMSQINILTLYLSLTQNLNVRVDGAFVII